MDATCAIQDSIHVFSLVRKYVSRILGTYHNPRAFLLLQGRMTCTTPLLHCSYKFHSLL